MFASIQVDEPIEKIAEDWDYLADRISARFSAFRGVGHNVLGLRRRIISAAGMDDPKKGRIGVQLELGPGGIVTDRHTPGCVRITTAGTPHRIPHNFGYWHINDKDELYLQLPAQEEGELGHSVIVMGMPTGDETDAFAWYCEKCTTMLFDFVVETGEKGIAEFWRGEGEAVRQYNADPKLRTCPECGHFNPPGYRWNKAKHTAEEAEGQLLW